MTERVRISKGEALYWSREYARSLEEGQNYNELPNVLAINIVNYNYPPVREVHTCFHLREDRHREYILTEALEIHFLNMVQYRRQWKGKLDDPLSRWLAWLNMGNGKELAEEAIKMDSAIQAANDRMVYVTGDKEEIRAYERYLMALSDYTSEMDYARDEGRAEGILEIAGKMKKAGRPLSEIAGFTGLPAETIEQL